MYLLDTNHCSRLLDRHPAMVEKLKKLGDARVVTCVIVRGELVFMAHRSRRVAGNLRAVGRLLGDMDVLSVDDETAEIYGGLKAKILAEFGPRERAGREKVRLTDLGFQDNDLWIAAVSKRHGCTVVSADSDFVRMQQVEDLAVESWWLPERGKRSHDPG